MKENIKKDIIIELTEVLSNNNVKSDDQQYNDLKKANDYYNEMIQKGIIKKRGFTLRGIEDTHLLNIRPQS